MQKVMKIWISKTNHPKLFYFAKNNALLSKCLYNAALFRMRQTFTGWNKEKRTANENEIFTELELLRKHYPKLRIDQLLTYKALDKLMRVTHNPDYFAGLPMQTAEAVAREVQQNFDDWMKSLNSYKDDPTGYTGRPKMPGYLKGGEHTFTVTNQDAVLYPAKEGGADLKLPGFRKKEREHLEGITADCDLRQVVFKPFCGGYIMSLTIKEETLEMDEQLPNYAGIDLGADNLAAISCTDGSCIVYKGGAVLAANRRFAKERADAVSQITSGHKHKHADSRHLRFLSRRHEFFIYDQFHKITTDAVRWLATSIGAMHRMGVVVHNYIDDCLLDVRNIDLPRKVRFRAHRKKPEFKVDKGCRVGRSYKEFEAFMENDRSPYETFSFHCGEEMLKLLGCTPVAAEDILLKPSLLKK